MRRERNFFDSRGKLSRPVRTKGLKDLLCISMHARHLFSLGTAVDGSSKGRPSIDIKSSRSLISADLHRYT